MALERAYRLCFILLLLQLPFYTIAQIPNNITLGSSLIAHEGRNSFWASPSGDFAFGFRKICDKDGFLLAIWFDKIPEKTVVWSANGNNLVRKGSRVELTADGQFILIDIATGKLIWIAPSAGTGVTHAIMLDTGNFVLANGNGVTSWESFDRPTDTILPTQTLHQGSILFSPDTPTSYSKGRFQFIMQYDGNLVLYTTHFPLDSSNSPYWATGTNYRGGFQVIFNQSGVVYLTDRYGTILNVISSSNVSIQDYYQRATLEYDGVLRHYVYPKSTSSSVKRSWSTVSITPSNICTKILEATGGGACGYNSLCENDAQGPKCYCPYGYTYIDPNDVLRGCKQDFVSQSCDDASQETKLFYLQDMLNTDWANSPNYEYFQPVTEDWCRQECLGDCFCAVAFYKGNTCWKKSLPLSNGRIDPSVDWKAMVKIGFTHNSTSTYAGPAVM